VKNYANFMSIWFSKANFFSSILKKNFFSVSYFLTFANDDDDDDDEIFLQQIVYFLYSYYARQEESYWNLSLLCIFSRQWKKNYICMMIYGDIYRLLCMEFGWIKRIGVQRFLIGWDLGIFRRIFGEFCINFGEFYTFYLFLQLWWV